MEKKPNLKIGEQEFQKVGKMEPEPTDLRDAPKKFNLYQDTESGALMGTLPGDHPLYFKDHTPELEQEIEQKAEERSVMEEVQNQLEAVGSIIDLTELTPYEVEEILKVVGVNKINRIPSWPPGLEAGGNFEEDLKIYGGINGGREGELVVFRDLSNSVSLFYKDDIGKVFRAQGLTEDRQYDRGRNELKSIPRVKVKSGNIKISGKNTFLVGNENDESKAEISFLEVPKGYTELMEKKEGKAT